MAEGGDPAADLEAQRGGRPGALGAQVDVPDDVVALGVTEPVMALAQRHAARLERLGRRGPGCLLVHR
jgi:hypothetical protein